MNKVLTQTVTNYKKVYSTLMWLNATHSVTYCAHLYRSVDPASPNKQQYAFTEFNQNVYVRLNWTIYVSGTFKYKEEDEIKTSFSMNQHNIYQFITVLNNVCRWFVDKEFENLFAKNSAGDIIPTKAYSLKVLDCWDKDYLEFLPATNNNDPENPIGVNMYFSECQIPCYVAARNILSLKYIIEHFDPYGYGMQLVNYLNLQSDDSKLSTLPPQKKSDNSAKQQTVLDPTKGSFFAKMHAEKR